MMDPDNISDSELDHKLTFPDASPSLLKEDSDEDSNDRCKCKSWLARFCSMAPKAALYTLKPSISTHYSAIV